MNGVSLFEQWNEPMNNLNIKRGRVYFNRARWKFQFYDDHV